MTTPPKPWERAALSPTTAAPSPSAAPMPAAPAAGAAEQPVQPALASPAAPTPAPVSTVPTPEASLSAPAPAPAPAAPPAVSAADRLIKQAVAFLTNPDVKHTPADKKRAFLLSKGLTAAQVDEAFAKLASMQTTSTAVMPAAPTAQQPQPQPLQQPQPQPQPQLQTESASSGAGWLLAAGAAAGIVGGLVSSGAARQWLGAWTGAKSEAGAGSAGAAASASSVTATASAAAEAAQQAQQQQQQQILDQQELLSAVQDNRKRLDEVQSSLASMRALLETAERAPSTAAVVQGKVSAALHRTTLQEALATFCAADEGGGVGMCDDAPPAGAVAKPELAHALHTLLVQLNSQLRHPTDKRYHRIHAANANFKRALALPGARGVLGALGYVECEGGTTWQWRGASGGAAGGGDGGAASSDGEIEELRAARDELQAALARVKPAAEPDAELGSPLVGSPLAP